MNSNTGNLLYAAAGLNQQLHSYGINVEGEWDDVIAAIKQCHEKLHDMGAPELAVPSA